MVLDRYIARLWLGPFLASLAIATGVLLLGRALKVMALVVDKGMEWGLMATMLAAILPYFLVLTVPIAFFFACQSVIIRLNQESELDAMRAAGISYLRILRPLIAIGVLLWLVLSVTAMQWMPKGQRAFQTLLFAIQQAKPAMAFDPQRFNQELEGLTVYVAGKDDQGRFVGFFLEDAREKTPVVYLASLAEIELDADRLRFTLHHGTRLEGTGAKLRALAFEEYRISLDVDDMGILKIPAWRNRIFEMDAFELWKERQAHDSPQAAAEWHRRWILPTMGLVLLLFVLPLSIEPKRSGKAGAYLAGILVILALYNLHILLHQQVAHGNLPWWALWLGQVAMAGVGFELSRRTAMDRQPRWLAGFGEGVYLLHEKLRAKLAARYGSD